MEAEYEQKLLPQVRQLSQPKASRNYDSHRSISHNKVFILQYYNSMPIKCFMSITVVNVTRVNRHCRKPSHICIE